MLIEAPFKISIVDKSDSQSKELHLTFTDSFSNCALDERVSMFEKYINELSDNIQQLPADSQDRKGMLIIDQLTGQLLPHIASNELELDETIVVEINKEITLNNLIEKSLLN
ncbi:MAG: transcriptional regulator [Gammaproteobacteria bacterium]|nr:transcriptional regulator [Gammaproteobacteria bacterium]